VQENFILPKKSYGNSDANELIEVPLRLFNIFINYLIVVQVKN